MKKAPTMISIEEPPEGDLPEGWTLVPLMDLCQLIRGVSYQKGEAAADPAPGLVPLLRANNIDGELVFGDLRYVPARRVSQEQILCVGDVVLAMSSGSKTVVGKAASVKTDWHGTFGAFCGVLRPSAFLHRDYFGRFFSTRKYRKTISEASAGVNINNLKREYFEALEFPLAPRGEQQRIVAKVEGLLARLAAVHARLARAPKILKAFRQSVLSAACSGRLTEDWREASAEIDDAGDLPAGWHRILLSDLVPKGGIFDGPFGSNLKTADYTGSGVRVIRLENIGWLSFVSSKESFISKEKYASLAKHTVGEGDIIFASFIEDAIRTCVLPPLPTKAIAKADCFCIRPKAGVVDRSFLALQLTSRESYDYLHGEIHGATRPRVNTTQLKQLPIRICSLPEQREIVRRVEALFALAARIEERVTTAAKRSEILTQAILAKAFRGELVPTEAELARKEGRDYEAASVLLARICSERETASAANGVRRRKTARRN